MPSLATIAPARERLAERRCENLLVEARINAQNIDASGEFRKQTTKGGKVENRACLSDSFASHLLTYGETHRQEQHSGGATTGFPDAKIDFSSGWLQDEITLRDLPVTFSAGRVTTTTRQQRRLRRRGCG